jgi:hypothetical protein
MTKNLSGRNVPNWAIYTGGSISILMGVSGIFSLILKNPALLSVSQSAFCILVAGTALSLILWNKK